MAIFNSYVSLTEGKNHPKIPMIGLMIISPGKKNDVTMIMADRFFPMVVFSKKTSIWNKM